jgi:hypothetical protein
VCEGIFDRQGEMMRMIRAERRILSGAHRHGGFVIRMPHTRSGQKHIQGYVQTLRPVVGDIAATREIDRVALAEVRDLNAIGAAYLGAILDDLGRHLAGGSGAAR